MIEEEFRSQNSEARIQESEVRSQNPGARFARLLPILTAPYGRGS